MTVLAFKMSRYANGVSALHGRIHTKSWQVLRRTAKTRFPSVTSRTACTCAPGSRPRCRTWPPSTATDWRDHLADPRMWAHRQRPDAELWETHRVLKAALVRFVRRRVSEQRRRNDYPEELVSAAKDALDPALTIGFARETPLQARQPDLPRHGPPQAADHELVAAAADRVFGQGPPGQIVQPGGAAPGARGRVRRRSQDRVVFIEDYDINVGRHLVQGVDVWLNSPRRPQEAAAPAARSCC